MDIIVEAKKAVQLLGLVVLLLLLAHLAGQFSIFYLNHDYVFGLVPMFDLKNGGNIPSLYSSISLVFCSVLLSIIAYAKNKRGEPYYHWAGLAVIFLFLCADQSVGLHGRLDAPLRAALKVTGVLYFAWVIPYSIALIIFLLIYLKFILKLPSRIRLLFIVAGLIYVTGAIALESVGGLYRSSYGEQRSIIYAGISTLEQLLEMIGILVFIYALLFYIGSELKGLSLKIISTSSAPSPSNNSFNQSAD